MDRQKQEIPWIEVRNERRPARGIPQPRLRGARSSSAAIPKDEMDCMDCHNRPTHNFPAAGDRGGSRHDHRAHPQNLPWAKSWWWTHFRPRIPHAGEGPRGAQGRDRGLLPAKYPALYEARKADVEKAAKTATEIYDRSVFPAMRVNWKT